MSWHNRLFHYCDDVCVGDITNAKPAEWWNDKSDNESIKESEPSDFFKREKDKILVGENKKRKLNLKIKTPYNEQLQYLKDAAYRRKYEPRKTNII